MNLVWLTWICLLHVTLARHHTWSGNVSFDMRLDNHDTIAVHNLTTFVGGIAVLPCNIALTGDPVHESILMVEILRFGRPRDSSTVHCDVHLTNLTLVLQHPSDLLDHAALHYYRLQWHNVKLFGHARLEADGGELTATALHLPGGSALDVRNLTIVHIHESVFASSELHLHQINVLSLTHNTVVESALSLTHVEEADRAVPRIVDLFANTVRASTLDLQCTQADVKTTYAADGLSAFAVLDRSVVSPSCAIDYAAPPSPFSSFLSILNIRF